MAQSNIDSQATSRIIKAFSSSVEAPDLRSQELLSGAFIRRTTTAVRFQTPLNALTGPPEPAGHSLTSSPSPTLEQFDPVEPRVPPPGDQEESFVALHLWEGYV